MKQKTRNPVGRTLQVLQTMMSAAPSKNWGVRELASVLDMNVSAAHRILSGLVNEEWVHANESTGTYQLSLEVLRLSMSLTSSFTLRQISLPYMHELVGETGETALLGLFDPERLKMSFIAQVESDHPLRYVITQNQWGPIHAGATGLAIAAFLSEELQNFLIERTELNKLTEQTLIERDSLIRTFETIRREGYALTKGQRIPGSVGIAAPIFGPNKLVLGDIAITVPESRYNQLSEKGRLPEYIMKYADRITTILASNQEK